MADALTGRTQRQQLALAREAQAQQQRDLAEQKRKLTAIEEGQRAIGRGGGGLFAFIDQPLDGQQNGLKTKLGGERKAVAS